MFYSFDYAPGDSDTASSPYVLDLRLTAGVIHQIDVLFQSGCTHKVFVQIWDGNTQIWPSNRGGKLKGDATVISFREFYELIPGNTILKAKVWTTLSSNTKEIVINIGVLPKEILQPLSFKELIAAATTG
jgi:hypothetical protein